MLLGEDERGGCLRFGQCSKQKLGVENVDVAVAETDALTLIVHINSTFRIHT